MSRRIILIVLLSFFIFNISSCKKQSKIYETVYVTSISLMDEFSNDFENSLTKYQDKKLFVTGIINNIIYPEEANFLSSSTVHFEFDGVEPFSLRGNRMSCEMKDRISEDCIGSEIVVECFLDSVYKDEDGILIFLIDSTLRK